MTDEESTRDRAPGYRTARVGPFGLFLPLLAVLGYLGVAVYIIVPFGAIRRLRHRP